MWPLVPATLKAIEVKKGLPWDGRLALLHVRGDAYKRLPQE
jgi:hypothetical protein